MVAGVALWGGIGPSPGESGQAGAVDGAVDTQTESGSGGEDEEPEQANEAGIAVEAGREEEPTDIQEDNEERHEREQPALEVPFKFRLAADPRDTHSPEHEGDDREPRASSAARSWGGGRRGRIHGRAVQGFWDSLGVAARSSGVRPTTAGPAFFQRNSTMGVGSSKPWG